MRQYEKENKRKKSAETNIPSNKNNELKTKNEMISD